MEHYHPCFINQLYNDIEFDGETVFIDASFFNSKYNFIPIDKFIEKVKPLNANSRWYDKDPVLSMSIS